MEGIYNPLGFDHLLEWLTRPGEPFSSLVYCKGDGGQPDGRDWLGNGVDGSFLVLRVPTLRFPEMVVQTSSVIRSVTSLSLEVSGVDSSSHPGACQEGLDRPEGAPRKLSRSGTTVKDLKQKRRFPFQLLAGEIRR